LAVHIITIIYNHMYTKSWR